MEDALIRTTRRRHAKVDVGKWRYYFYTLDDARIWAYLLGCRVGFDMERIVYPKPFRKVYIGELK